MHMSGSMGAGSNEFHCIILLGLPLLRTKQMNTQIPKIIPAHTNIRNYSVSYNQ